MGVFRCSLPVSSCSKPDFMAQAICAHSSARAIPRPRHARLTPFNVVLRDLPPEHASTRAYSHGAHEYQPSGHPPAGRCTTRCRVEPRPEHLPAPGALPPLRDEREVEEVGFAGGVGAPIPRDSRARSRRGGRGRARRRRAARQRPRRAGSGSRRASAGAPARGLRRPRCPRREPARARRSPSSRRGRGRRRRAASRDPPAEERQTRAQPRRPSRTGRGRGASRQTHSARSRPRPGREPRRRSTSGGDPGG